MTKTKKLSFLGLFLCLALILSYVESVIPPFFPALPGIKIGLTNIIILFLLYKFSVKEAAAVSAARLILSSVFFGTALSFIYSAAGAVLSLCIMYILKKTDLFSKVGVSVAGAVFHNLGQVIVAIIIMQTKEIAYYLIPLTFSALISGTVIGISGGLLIKYLSRKII